MDYFNYKQKVDQDIYKKKTLKYYKKWHKDNRVIILDLKKSSLDLTPYTNIVELECGSSMYILYNNDIITIAKITQDELVGDYLKGKLLYHKTFDRSDILNNLDGLDEAIKKLPNLISKKYQNGTIFEELGFSLEYPLLTKHGWYSTVSNQFYNSVFLYETDSIRFIIYDEYLEIAIFSSNDRATGKVNLDDFISKKISLDKLYLKEEYLEFKYLAGRWDIFEIVKQYDKNIYSCLNVEGKKCIIEKKDKDHFIEEYETIVEDDDGIHFLDRYESEVYFFTTQNNTLLMYEKIIQFNSNIKKMSNEESEQSIRYLTIVLLENKELYVANIKILDNVLDYEIITDINDNVVIVKTDSYVVYVADREQIEDIEYSIFPYQGEGIPFFIQKQKIKNYEKYNYVSIAFEDHRRPNKTSYNPKDGLDKLDYIKLTKHKKGNKDRYYLILNQDETIKIDDNEGWIITSSKFKRNSPYTFFIRKNDYIVFYSHNQKEISVYVKDKDNIYNSILFFTSYSEDYERLKEYFKLTNLPNNIYLTDGLLKKHIKKIFEYDDFRVSIDYNGKITREIIE